MKFDVILVIKCSECEESRSMFMGSVGDEKFEDLRSKMKPTERIIGIKIMKQGAKS